MKRYQVVSITVGGKANKIFNHGDVVTEDQFLEGHAESYVKSGHLKVHKPTKKELAADAAKAEANDVYVSANKVKAEAEAELKVVVDEFTRCEAALQTSENNQLENDKAFKAATEAQEAAVSTLTAAEEAKETSASNLEAAKKAEKELPKNAAKAKVTAAKKEVANCTKIDDEATTALSKANKAKDAADSAFDSAKKVQAESTKSLGNIQKSFDEASDKKDAAQLKVDAAIEDFEKAKEAKVKAYS